MLYQTTWAENDKQHEALLPRQNFLSHKTHKSRQVGRVAHIHPAGASLKGGAWCDRTILRRLWHRKFIPTVLMHSRNGTKCAACLCFTRQPFCLCIVMASVLLPADFLHGSQVVKPPARVWLHSRWMLPGANVIRLDENLPIRLRP